VPKPKPSTITRDPHAITDPYHFIPQGNSLPVSSPGKLALPERAAEPERKAKSEKISLPIPVELIERVRDAAYWERMTLASIIEEALTDKLDRMEKGRGAPYEPRTGKLHTGRPLGSGKRT
jgi:hypothetical protein